MRQSFIAIYDRQFRTVYFPSEIEAVPTYGRYPWEFADPEFHETIKESFRLCLETNTPQFHIARLAANTNEHAGLCLCAWLTPVTINAGCPLYQACGDGCDTPCATIIAKCVIVPPIFHKLTRREREVLAKLSVGDCPNKIAQDFGIARSTVDTLLGRIRKKLEVEDSVQVAQWATTYRDILQLDPHLCSDHLHKIHSKNGS